MIGVLRIIKLYVENLRRHAWKYSDRSSCSLYMAVVYLLVVNHLERIKLTYMYSNNIKRQRQKIIIDTWLSDETDSIGRTCSNCAAGTSFVIWLQPEESNNLIIR